MSAAELARRQRIATEQALADTERRLANAEWYAKGTAPGAPNESANSHAQWSALAAELKAQAAELRANL